MSENVRESAEKRRAAVQRALKAATYGYRGSGGAGGGAGLIRSAAEAARQYNAGLLPDTEHEEHVAVLRRGEGAERERVALAAQDVAAKCGVRVMIV